MSERKQATWAVVALGAAVGGAIAYVMFTADGRKIRAKLEPKVADLLRELDRWGATDHVKRAVLGGLGFSGPAARERSDDPS